MGNNAQNACAGSLPAAFMPPAACLNLEKESVQVCELTECHAQNACKCLRGGMPEGNGERRAEEERRGLRLPR